jgi:hypothetical protein
MGNPSQALIMSGPVLYFFVLLRTSWGQVVTVDIAPAAKLLSRLPLHADSLGNIMGDAQAEIREKDHDPRQPCRDGQCLLLALFSKPIMNAHRIAKELNVFFATSTRITKDFQRIGILKEITVFSRNRSFASAEYLALFMK